MSAITRTTIDPLDANLCEWLACQAIAYRRDCEGPEALTWALALAGLMHSANAEAPVRHI